MLLILREEIGSIIILAFLIFYYCSNKVKDRERPFLQILCFAMLHNVFDMITIITVNNADKVGEDFNNAMHIYFYISGILFVIAFYNYVIKLCGMYRQMRLMKIIGYAPLVVFVGLLLFIPMEYVKGNGTYYSYGPLAFIGYGIFVVYCALSLVLLMVFRERLGKREKRALIPMVIVMFSVIVMQALIPELLMTGMNTTFICLGMFIALDNPDKMYEEQALWDFLTGLKNRNCYNRDLEQYLYKVSKRKRKSENSIGFVVADMNFLKRINDNYGHVEGDSMIAASAAILNTCLVSAENVYRIGGDEFTAIYLSPDDDRVAKEIRNVKEAAKKVTGHVMPLSIAIGYASGTMEGNVDEIFQKADERMYEDKQEMKKAAGELPDAR